MLHRAAGTAFLLGSLLLGACKSSDAKQEPSSATKTEVVAPLPTEKTPADATPGALAENHGDKWVDEEDPKTMGGMAMFKEAWVYVDGKAVGVLREAEFPPLPEVWVDQVEYLDFKPGDPGPHERIYQVRRWALADYFEAVGVDLKKIKTVLLHGGRGSVFIDGKDFRKLRKKFLFDLTGNNNLKLRVFVPDEIRPKLNTSFDRYAAISVIVDKPAPTTNESNDVLIDGVIAEGIPYYGQPLRGGVRVYLDGALALVIKRNALGDEGRVAPGKDEWSVRGLLEARGVKAELGAADVIDKDQTVSRVDGSRAEAMTFKTDSQAQGSVVLDSGEKISALMLWSEGKVPPPRVFPSPSERDKPEKK
jgi:hypothetical protein